MGIVSPYDPDNGIFYRITNGTRLDAEQAALDGVITDLMQKNDPSGENSDNIEIAVISFATFKGKDQTRNYQGGIWNSNTEVDWQMGRDKTSLMRGINDDSSVARGTNWEEGLKYATEIMNAKKTAEIAAGHADEDYYIVFLTDGGPTATTYSITQEDGAYYGTSGHYDWQRDNQNRPRNSCEPAYQDATDEARALVESGYKLYNIFTYGTNDDYKYLVRLTNYAYGESEYIYDNVHDNVEPQDYFPDSAAAQKYFTNATDTEKLVEAFQNIFSEISVTQSHVQVKITDGLRQDALTSSFVNGKPSGVTYTVAPKDSPNAPIYTVTATVPENSTEPVVTFKIGNNTYSTTDNQVVKHVKEPVEGDPLASYDAGTYYSVTVGGVEYKMALASVVPTADENVNTLTWDLSPVGMLMDDCVYKADFIVWPNQDAYDYVAALNNGLTEIPDPEDETVDPIQVVWNQDDAVPKTDSNNKTYYVGGCEKYPSIVYYPDPDNVDVPDKKIYFGTFAVLTNTDQNLDYSIVTTENGEVTSVVPQNPIPMELPDPMNLTATGSRVSKLWNVSRDPDALLRLLYEFDGNMPKKDEHGNPIPKQYEVPVLNPETGAPVIDEETGEPEMKTYNGFFIDFNILQDTNNPAADPYRTVRLGWDEDQGKYVWYEGTGPGAPYVRSKTYGTGADAITLTYGTRWEQDFSIATGLMVTRERLEELHLNPDDYAHGKYPDNGTGTDYYLLEDGHDYTLSEPDLGYEFDFDAPTYHPMLVNGVMKDVRFTRTGEKTISISKIEDLEISTDGMSLLEIINTLRGYIHVKKVVVADNYDTQDDETKFTYDVNLYNDDGAFTVEGFHIPWYGIDGLFYHTEVTNEEGGVDYQYYQAIAVGTETTDSGKIIGILTLTDEHGNTYRATCDGAFNENTVGPTDVTFEQDGVPRTISLHGNQMDYSEEVMETDSGTGDPVPTGAYRKVHATFMITQKQQLNIANVPVSTRYEITERDERGYEFVRIESTAASDMEGKKITGTIIPNSDTEITYTNKAVTGDLNLKKQVTINEFDPSNAAVTDKTLADRKSVV